MAYCEYSTGNHCIESFSYEWEHCTVTIRYGYSRNFECFYRNYDTGTVTIRCGKFPTHTKTTLLSGLVNETKTKTRDRIPRPFQFISIQKWQFSFKYLWKRDIKPLESIDNVDSLTHGYFSVHQSSIEKWQKPLFKFPFHGSTQTKYRSLDSKNKGSLKTLT